MESTRSGWNPRSTFSTDHRLRTSRPAPTSRMIAKANSVTTRARRIRRVATPPAMPRAPSWPEGRRVRRIKVIAGAKPIRMAVRRQRPRVQPSDAWIEADFVQAGQVHGLLTRMRRMAASAISKPDRPDSKARVRLSASSCRTIRAVAGSERRSHGEFPFAADTASQREACDVGGSDEKNTEDRACKHPQRQPRAGPGHLYASAEPR